MVCSVIFSENGASHMNARATLLNGRSVKENGGRMVIYIFFGPSVFQSYVCNFLNCSVAAQLLPVILQSLVLFINTAYFGHPCLVVCHKLFHCTVLLMSEVLIKLNFKFKN
jgi:hypothetical protein